MASDICPVTCRVELPELYAEPQALVEEEGEGSFPCLFLCRRLSLVLRFVVVRLFELGKIIVDVSLLVVRQFSSLF